MSAGAVTAEQAATALVDRMKEVALCLDYDGTLSPVVDDPQAARPLRGVVEMLGTPASRFAAVAIISGRPAAYLGEHVTAPGVRYLGLYGLQEMHDGRIRVDPRLEAARPTVVAAAEALRESDAERDSGARLEDKAYAVAVHTRRVPDRERWGAVAQAEQRSAGTPPHHDAVLVAGDLVAGDEGGAAEADRDVAAAGPLLPLRRGGSGWP